MEAPANPTASTTPAFRAASATPPRARKIERQRLFDKDVLARRRRRQRLRLMLAVRRRQHHRVDILIAQDFFVAVKEVISVAAKILGGRARARAGEHKTDVVALAGGTDATSDGPSGPVRRWRRGSWRCKTGTGRAAAAIDKDSRHGTMIVESE